MWHSSQMATNTWQIAENHRETAETQPLGAKLSISKNTGADLSVPLLSNCHTYHWTLKWTEFLDKIVVKLSTLVYLLNSFCYLCVKKKKKPNLAFDMVYMSHLSGIKSDLFFLTWSDDSRSRYEYSQLFHKTPSQNVWNIPLIV